MMKKRTIKNICLTLIMAMMLALLPTGAYAKSKEVGKYNPKSGQILVTSDGPFGHAAIVLDPKKNSVVEAVGHKGGIKKGKLSDWKKKKEFWLVEVKGVSASNQKKAAEWCLKQVGKPYNGDFGNMSTRNSFYCSQLVWAAYKDVCKIDLNTKSVDWISVTYGIGKYGISIKPCLKKQCMQISPKELVNTNKTITKYYYKK